MKIQLVALVSWMACSSGAWAQDGKVALDQSRANYQQAVARHGKNSPEARSARQQLRSNRHSFHSQRRQKTEQKPHQRGV